MATAYSFPTTVALLAAFPATPALPDGTIALTAGRSSEGDGGGAEFYYDASDTSSADNGGTIRVDGTGRRFKYSGKLYTPELFGAAGNGIAGVSNSVDDAAAIQSMFNVLGPGITAYMGGVYGVSTTLTIPNSYSHIILTGTIQPYQSGDAGCFFVAQGDYFTLEGKGQGTINGTISNGFGAIQLYNSASAFQQSPRITGLTFLNLNVGGTGQMVTIQWCDKGYMAQCKFINCCQSLLNTFSGGFCIYGAYNRDMTYEEITAENSAATFLQTGGAGLRNTVRNCHAENVTDFAFKGGYGYAISALDMFYAVRSVKIANGGSGYVSGDIGKQYTISPGPGTAVIQIDAISGGAVTAFSVVNPGNYTGPPVYSGLSVYGAPPVGSGASLSDIVYYSVIWVPTNTFAMFPPGIHIVDLNSGQTGVYVEAVINHGTYLELQTADPLQSVGASGHYIMMLETGTVIDGGGYAYTGLDAYDYNWPNNISFVNIKGQGAGMLQNSNGEYQGAGAGGGIGPIWVGNDYSPYIQPSGVTVIGCTCTYSFGNGGVTLFAGVSDAIIIGNIFTDYGIMTDFAAVAMQPPASYGIVVNASAPNPGTRIKVSKNSLNTGRGGAIFAANTSALSIEDCYLNAQQGCLLAKCSVVAFRNCDILAYGAGYDCWGVSLDSTATGGYNNVIYFYGSNRIQVLSGSYGSGAGWGIRVVDASASNIGVFPGNIIGVAGTGYNVGSPGQPSAYGTTYTNQVLPSGVAGPPTSQVFLSGSGTYYTPAGVQWIEVKLVGGGGGGSGGATSPGNGSSGGTTSFGSYLYATGGVGGLPNGNQGGLGGYPSVSSPAIDVGCANGGSGGPSFNVFGGGMGGGSYFGGGGGGGNGSFAGYAGVAYGSGGGGGGNLAGPNSGSGGGAGGFVDSIIGAPAASYAYSVGAGGAGGAAGSGGFAGGAGAPGYIVAIEHYSI